MVLCLATTGITWRWRRFPSRLHLTAAERFPSRRRLTVAVISYLAAKQRTPVVSVLGSTQRQHARCGGAAVKDDGTVVRKEMGGG
ncbi:hypothetical protein OsJ_33917 [Oryza sativa Japonica Group]|uniref:Uncharacterized protein n=1 Tax=Oryza sativa subsp. japonica TaxID=39947 RepID=B9GAR0_ORYSJ|nr:hypothetical protein OsJ_33917 [Oryza sativa Japonica Group]